MNTLEARNAEIIALHSSASNKLTDKRKYLADSSRKLIFAIVNAVIN